MERIKTMNIAIFVPHQGCKNDCIFCNQKRITEKERVAENKLTSSEKEEIAKYIESCVATGSKKGIKNEYMEIAFFGGSFTGIEEDRQREYLEIANYYVIKEGLKGIRMSTRPDYITKEIMEFLRSYKVSAIELGVQSLHQDVMNAAKRNHSIEDVIHACQLIKEYDISLGLQIMLGLPEDTEEKLLETVQKIIELEPETLRIYPTLVLKDTELADDFYVGRYTALTLDKAVYYTARIIRKLKGSNIRIIRIGLQDNEGLRKKEHMLAGPYHPAFYELVRDRLVVERLEEIIEKQGVYDIVSFTVNRKTKQLIMGHKKEVYQFLRNKFQNELFIYVDQSFKDEVVKAVSSDGEVVTFSLDISSLL